MERQIAAPPSSHSLDADAPQALCRQESAPPYIAAPRGQVSPRDPRTVVLGALKELQELSDEMAKMRKRMDAIADAMDGALAVLFLPPE